LATAQEQTPQYIKRLLNGSESVWDYLRRTSRATIMAKLKPARLLRKA
jgi:hypothetical protein